MSKELYDKVISAYQSGNTDTFSVAARNWVEGAKDAPFEDVEACSMFNAAKRYCKLWRSKAINGRVSKLRMIECIRKIAEKNLPNPYKEEKKKRVLNIVEKESETKEPQIVLGVIPEEPAKKRIFGKRKRK